MKRNSDSKKNPSESFPTDEDLANAEAAANADTEKTEETPLDYGSAFRRMSREELIRMFLENK